MSPVASEAQAPDRLLRLVEVQRHVGLGKTMIYAMIGEGRFPKPYKVTPTASRWSEREIIAWIDRVKGGAKVDG